jgi:hypothetical protein
LVSCNEGRRVSRKFAFEIGIQRPLDSTQFEFPGVGISVERVAFWIRVFIIVYNYTSCLKLTD